MKKLTLLSIVVVAIALSGIALAEDNLPFVGSVAGAAGSGDMTKAVYDTDSNNVVDTVDSIAGVPGSGVTPWEGGVTKVATSGNLQFIATGAVSVDILDDGGGASITLDVGAGQITPTHLDTSYALDSYLGAASIDLSGATPTGTLPVANGGTGNTASGTSNDPVVSDGSNLIPVNPGSFRAAAGLVIGSDVQVYDATYLVDADIGVNVQAYDANNLSGDTNTATPTGAYDFSGGILEIPQASDPDLTAAGQIAYDTDDHTLQIGDGTNARDILSGHTIYMVIPHPDVLDARDSQPIWKNRTGKTFVITSAYFSADDDNVNFDIYSGTSPYDYTKATDIFRSVTIDTDENGVYYTAYLSGTTSVADGISLILDFDDTDTPDWIEIILGGYFSD